MKFIQFLPQICPKISTDKSKLMMADCPTFYDDAKAYWGGVPATVDGMLGGFAHISNTDISGSTKFLRQFIRVAIYLLL
jgi:protein N-terminal methyltransferase